MPQPATSDVHVDAVLTTLSIAYIQDAMDYVAGQVFSTLPVAKQSDKYFTYNKDDFKRGGAKKRAPGTETAGGGFELGTDSYSCDVWGLHKDLDDQTRSNMDDPLNGDEDSMRWVTDQMLISREDEFVTNFFTTGLWGTDVVGSTDFAQWDDAASDPEKDVSDAKIAIKKATGYMPNRMVVSFEVHEALKRHPLIKDRYKYTSPDSITKAMLARFFEIEQYIVAGAIETTDEEGAASISYDFIIGKNVLICYANPNPSLLQPSAGYNFVWSGYTDLNDLGIKFKNFRIEAIESDRVEGLFAFDMKLVAADLGYFMSSVIS